MGMNLKKPKSNLAGHNGLVKGVRRDGQGVGLVFL